ncbi:YbhB/YbcL family Raf kinase inhibitor-like protein [Curtobacterium sp. MCPF17_047]|uniref:YbhB/YbcL family Raf kinase inhibitor-like protein n=1 Tax=unclassified Curtobacterium TaxID=257496 RepID=UPI000DA98F0B|nr:MULTISPECIES: YbhB/YbcL family Raf kinase inhibitor-like protein [unclassified Curtobacterium]PZE63035.1 YbhB/YbcL family Raf kinase inhibitor-like protein [Curtobacterium sp. MCPF17_001]PZF68966.1 YbhB/YbcL family Raf kinase inhibitor-like protein [Curtobacterium sp. MCPF17_047]
MTVGSFLRPFRAGEQHSVWNRPALRAPDTITVRSDGFTPNGRIPAVHRGQGAGENRSPSLHWDDVDGERVRALMIVLEDVDVPLPRPLVHTLGVLDPGTQRLAEGGLSTPTAGVQFARAAFGRTGYQGPRPLPGHGPHRYLFELYALDIRLDRLTTAAEALRRAADHVVARGRLVGVDERGATG